MPARASNQKKPNPHRAERCTAWWGMQRCVLDRGTENHNLRANNNGLRLPLLIHRTEDGTRWTSQGRID